MSIVGNEQPLRTMSRQTLYSGIVFVSSTTCATCTVRASAFGLLENWKQRTRSVADIATIDSGAQGQNEYAQWRRRRQRREGRERERSTKWGSVRNGGTVQQLCFMSPGERGCATSCRVSENSLPAQSWARRPVACWAEGHRPAAPVAGWPREASFSQGPVAVLFRMIAVDLIKPISLTK